MGSRLAFHICTVAAVLSVFVVTLGNPLIWEMNYYAPGMAFMLGILLLLPCVAFVVLVPIATAITLVWYLIARRTGYNLIFPLAISLAAIGIGLSVNTTSWWLMYNDWRFGEARAELLRTMVANPPALSEPTYFGIPVPSSSDGHLSLGAGPAYFKMTEKGPLVLFLTFTGIPDGFSGFLYAPAEVDPKQEWPEMAFEWADVWDNDRHVYFVGNR